MEDALSTDTDLADHVKTSTAPLPGIELAEALHYKQYPALVRFLLMRPGQKPRTPPRTPSHKCAHLDCR
jgi:RNA polymerase sigma-70 factor (ECF subfamily)